MKNRERRPGSLANRAWLPPASQALIDQSSSWTAQASRADIDQRIHALVRGNNEIHNRDCINLNPATNTMNPRAEALLAQGLGTRPSLGYPGDKYEMGLEAIEQIEIITAELAAEVFGARYVELRVPSGAIANLMAFMSLTSAGDAIVVPPPAVGGHVTHHNAGVAGLYGLRIHQAPVDAVDYTIDVDALGQLAATVRPKVITIGQSLNLFHHSVSKIREVADKFGAIVLFDAAHLSGLIAGGSWPNPLDEGAHLVTMSTYKSLGGPPSGLILTNEPAIAERLESVAFPGLTANFDVSKTAALALTLLDWQQFGPQYSEEMVSAARHLAIALHRLGLPVVAAGRGGTLSHAFALDASNLGGGTNLARRLRAANLLTSAIGLPTGEDDGLRIGTNELVRLGAQGSDIDELSTLIASAISDDPKNTAPAVSTLRRRLTNLKFVAGRPGTTTSLGKPAKEVAQSQNVTSITDSRND